AWSREDGFSLGQKAVSEKSNEITAIPELIERLQINGQIITIDAMGTQTAIVEKSGEKGQIETREYYQTEDIRWMIQKKDWKGLKSIAMERKIIEKNGRKKTEYRYFISSVKGDIETISRAVRGHWSIESMHWHLDVTFREDANTTLDKLSAQNLNIIRKWSLSILKLMELTKMKLSMKKKRFVISLSPIKYLEEVLDF
ncbi:ISAs1 family transposase, partial [Lachnospiraceae bacterium 66-29]